MKRRINIDGVRVEGAEARRIVDEATQEAHDAGRVRSVLALMGLVVLTLVVAVGSGWLALIVVRRVFGGPFPLWVWLVLTSVLTAVIVGAAYMRLMLPFHRREVREAMGRRGFELCPSCGYWLKGLGAGSTRCPECGAAREPVPESD
jgi:hypothetical protein